MPGAHREPAAREAGRGGLAIALAKLYFIITGLVQQIALKHILGLAGYGALGRVQSLASIVYNPIVATGIQGVSRAVSGSADADQPAAQRRALALHGAAIVPLAAVFFALAPQLAALIRAPHLTSALRVVATVVLLYGLYAPLVGVLNGKRRFSWQAGLDGLAATLRTIGLLGGAYALMAAGRGVEGALSGFALSVCIVLGVALAVAGLGRSGAGASSAPVLRDTRTRAYGLFVLPLFGGQIALNLLLQSDLTLLGRFAADAAAELLTPPPVLEAIAGSVHARAALEVLESTSARAADALAGGYRAAQLFCFLPYQLLLSVTFVLFPMLASAERDGDKEAIARYVATGVRLAMVLAGMMVSVTAGLPGPLLTLVFGADTAALGAQAMAVMALGLGAFAIFGILSTVLTSLKHEVLSAVLTLAALALVVVLCAALVRGRPFGPDMLVVTAGATGASLVTATLLAGLLVKAKARAVVAPLTLVRVLGATTLAIVVARALPQPGKLATLAYAVLVVLAYVAALTLSRELTKADATLVASVLAPRRAAI